MTRRRTSWAMGWRPWPGMFLARLIGLHSPTKHITSECWCQRKKD